MRLGYGLFFYLLTDMYAYIYSIFFTIPIQKNRSVSINTLCIEYDNSSASKKGEQDYVKYNLTHCTYQP